MSSDSMSLKLNPQEQANLRMLWNAYRTWGEEVTRQLIMDEVKEHFGAQPFVQKAVEEWIKAKIKAHDRDETIPPTPIDPEFRVAEADLPAPVLGAKLTALKKKREEEKTRVLSVSSSVTPQRGPSSSKGPAGQMSQSPAIRQRLSTVASKSPRPTTSGKQLPETPAGQHPPLARKRLPESAGKRPVDQFDHKAHNPAMVLDATSGQRLGANRHHPVLELQDFLFHSEREYGNNRPGFMGDSWIRTTTNFRFVNKKDQMVPISLGTPAKHLRMIGFSANCDPTNTVGARTMGGLWAQDAVSMRMGSNDALWLECVVTKIEPKKAAWFRGGKTEIVVVHTSFAQHVLQSPALNYNAFWVASGIKPAFKDVNLRAKNVSWVPSDLRDEVRDFAQRAHDQDLIHTPIYPRQTPAAIEYLDTWAMMVKEEWKIRDLKSRLESCKAGSKNQKQLNDALAQRKLQVESLRHNMKQQDFGLEEMVTTDSGTDSESYGTEESDEDEGTSSAALDSSSPSGVQAVDETKEVIDEETVDDTLMQQGESDGVGGQAGESDVSMDQANVPVASDDGSADAPGELDPASSSRNESDAYPQPAAVQEAGPSSAPEAAQSSSASQHARYTPTQSAYVHFSKNQVMYP